MICPVCQVNNTPPDLVSCMQCGADLKVHSLINIIRTELQANKQVLQLKKTKYSKLSSIFMILQIILSIVTTSLVIFIIVIGTKFLGFLERTELNNINNAAKLVANWSEHLQQMSSIISKQLNVINESRQQQTLPAQAELNNQDPAPPIIQEELP